MLRLLCVVSVVVCLSVCDDAADARSAWARFRQRKYADPIITEGVGLDGGPIEIVEDNIIGLTRKEEKSRFSNFKKTFALVNDVNSHQSEFKADINDFADYSDEEFDTNLLGLNLTRKMTQDKMFAPMVAGVSSESDGSDIPASLDWVERGKVTGIKFQGVCGSCWAFAATSVLESHYAIYGGILKYMSEQQLLDCVYKGEDACQGGWYSDGWVVIRSTLGNQLPTEESYTYLGATTECRQDRGSNALVAANVDYPQIVKVDYQEQQTGPYYDEELASAVAIGPVAVAMRVINTFKVYKGGLYTDKNCNGGYPNHAVVVVGYTAERFKVRNSWGTSWGETGYAWFDRRVQNLCHLAKWGEYPLLAETGKSDDKEKEGPCATISCLNKGVCAPSKDKKSAKCYCVTGYKGEFCQEKICADVLKRCPKPTSPKCQKRKYETKCPETCGTCFN